MLASSLQLILLWKEQLEFQAVLIMQDFTGMEVFCCLATLILGGNFGQRPVPNPVPLHSGKCWWEVCILPCKDITLWHPFQDPCGHW